MNGRSRARRSIGSVFVAAALALGAFEAPSRAEPTSVAAPAASAPPLRSTMAQIAARVASELRSIVKEPTVFVSPVRSDEVAPRGAELGSKLATLVAGAFGVGSSARTEPVGLATAEALTRTAKHIVYLRVEIARGQLQVNADVYPTVRNVWERARQPHPAPLGHLFAAGRIDGEVRSYLAPVPLVSQRIERVGVDERDLVAIACGDTGDGSLELVTLSRKRVAIGRVRGGRLVVRRFVALRDISPIAPAPLREPVGGIAIVPPSDTRPGFIDVGITDRARGARLDAHLGVLGPIAGVPFATPRGDACAMFQGNTLDATVSGCAETEPTAPELEAPLDAASSATYVTPDGMARAIFAMRDPRTAELKVETDGKTALLPHSGAQIALADLDEDGSPEIMSALDVLPQLATLRSDALVINTFEPDGSLRERSRTPVPSGVRAIAACPPEGPGTAAVVVATQGELWVVH